MISNEILSKVKKIELKSKKLVNDVFSGKYHSIFKGQGLEFSEVREYVPGDDIRRISWNVTARRNKPYIKMYDIKKHILRLIDTILSYKPRNKKTNIENALKYLNKLCKRKVLVFLISDFYDTNFDSMLKVTAKKHDLVCIKISDPKEQEIPKNGIFTIQDAETGLVMDIDFSSLNVKNEYYKNLNKHQDYLDETFKVSKTDIMNISTDRPYVLELIKFFKSRQEKTLKHY